MKISLLSEDSIRLEPRAGMLTIEAPDEHTQYSPFHMLASGLATCTYAVLGSWAANAGLEITDLAIEIRWSFVDNPHRIGSIAMDIDWASLPPERVAVAERAARLCAIHATFEHPPRVSVGVRK
ncbi:MAG TPA: OsmC family protein [Gemmatimonadaceae bacterium]|nr:OsmC family protein [Gemmatimonadaceae bacterium]